LTVKSFGFGVLGLYTVSGRALNSAVQRPPEKIMNLGIQTVCPYSLTVAGALLV